MTESPEISVIIPTYNRCQDLKRCLDSLVNQTYQNFEIIVIDNGSTDGTPDLIRKYPAKVVRNSTKKLSLLFNLGWREASSDLVAYINDDAEADPRWLETIVQTFKEEDADVIGGPTIATRKQEMLSLCESAGRSVLMDLLSRIYHVVVAENKFFDIGALCQSGAYSIGGSLPESAKLRHSIHVDLLTITNMAIRKSVIHEIGGFDEGFLFTHADGDLFIRLKRSHRKLVFNPKVVVWHHVNPQGATRVSHFLGRDQGYFYAKDIRPKDLQGRLRFMLNVFYFIMYWLYVAFRAKSVSPLRGISGFISGILYYIESGMNCNRARIRQRQIRKS